MPVDAYLEVGAKRVFAGALDWPGWCRASRNEEDALDALIAYGPRYARAMKGGRIAFTAPKASSTVAVVERLKGDATTDFGAPSIAPSADARPLDTKSLARERKVLRACWTAFDRAVEEAEGIELVKGPRGGGRDLDQIVGHVVGAEAGYARTIAAASPRDAGPDARDDVRSAVLKALDRAVREGLPEKGPRGGRMWTARYFVRRAAWHVLDHAWEIEDRSGRSG
jgi:hypothetical protein